MSLKYRMDNEQGMKSPEQVPRPKNPGEKFWVEMSKPALGWKGFCCGYGHLGWVLNVCHPG